MTDGIYFHFNAKINSETSSWELRKIARYPDVSSFSFFFFFSTSGSLDYLWSAEMGNHPKFLELVLHFPHPVKMGVVSCLIEGGMTQTKSFHVT